MHYLYLPSKNKYIYPKNLHSSNENLKAHIFKPKIKKKI
jgi:hypothetical protein